MKKLFENIGGNQFELTKEAKAPSSLKEEEKLRKVQKVLLQCAKEIDKAIRKIPSDQMKVVMSDMVHDLNQYGGGNEKGYSEVSVENLINWLKGGPKNASRKKPKDKSSGDWSGYLEPGRDYIPPTPYGE